MISVKISSFIYNLIIFYSMFQHSNGVFIRSSSNTIETDTTSLTAIMKMQQIVHALEISETGVMISPFSEQYFGCWG